MECLFSITQILWHDHDSFESLRSDLVEDMTAVHGFAKQILGGADIKPRVFYTDQLKLVGIEYWDHAHNLQINFHSHPGHPNSIISDEVWKDL